MTVKVLYRNYRGEEAVRTITPESIQWGEAEWHPGEQWLLWCYDCDKEAVRTFAMKDILAWGEEAIAQYLHMREQAESFLKGVGDGSTRN